MTIEEFRNVTAGSLIWQALGTCSVFRLSLATLLLLTFLVCAALFDHSLSIAIWTIPLLIVGSSLLAITAARYFGRKIARVLADLDDAFLDSAKATRAIQTFAQRPSRDVFWVGVVGLASGVLLYMSTPQSLPRLSRGCDALICLIGGIVFGFALVKYIWDYRLLWTLSREAVSIWKVHRLKVLASYNYSLTLVALLPSLITLYIWAARRKPELMGVAIIEGILAMCVFLKTEIGIVRMAKTSDVEVLDFISSMQHSLWMRIKADSGTDPNGIRELAHLESVRRSLSSGSAFGVISWGDFVSKIVVPFVAGAIGVIYQVLVSK